MLANLVFSCLLIYNSAPESMPFLFPSHLEETAALHVKFLVNYLGSLAQRKKRPLMGGLFLCADNYPVAQSGFFWYDISYIDQIK